MIEDLLTYSEGESLSDQENWVLGLGSILCAAEGVYNNATRSIVYHNQTFGENQRARVTLNNNYGSGRIGPAVRCDGNNGYIFIATAGSCYIARIVNGVEQILIADGSIGIEYFTTNILELTVEGTTLKAFINGFLRLEIEDSTFTEGYTGVSGRTVDNTSILKEFVSRNIPDILTGTATITGRFFSITRRSGRFSITRNKTWKFNITRNT